MFRRKLPNGSTEILFTAADGLNNVSDLHVDNTTGRLFILNEGNTIGTLYAGQRDGNGALTVVVDGNNSLLGPDAFFYGLDVVDGKVYLQSEAANNVIARMNADGTGIDTFLRNWPSLYYYDIAYDAPSNTVFSSGPGGNIFRATLTRNTTATRIETDSTSDAPCLQIYNGRIYWSETDYESVYPNYIWYPGILSRTLAGGNFQRLRSIPQSPNNFDFDPATGDLYFSTSKDNRPLYRLPAGSSTYTPYIANVGKGAGALTVY